MMEIKDNLTPDNVTILLWDIRMLAEGDGVRQFVRWRFPDWQWKYCQGCEEVSPLWGNFCAVCWTQQGG